MAIIQCKNPSSTLGMPRMFEVTTLAARAGAWQWVKLDMTYMGVDEIVSVGLGGSAANEMAAASSYVLYRTGGTPVIVPSASPTIVGTGSLVGGVYTVLATDGHLQVTATATVSAQVNLMAGSTGAKLIVTNSGGDPATAKQVTVMPVGADTVLGSTSLLLDGRDSVTLAYNTATTDWEVL
jgi:hypothetical protein